MQFSAVLCIPQSSLLFYSPFVQREKMSLIALSPICLLHTGVFASRIISSLTFAPLGSSRVSKEAKNVKELGFLGLGRCFSVRTEESSKTSKIQPKTVVFGRFFKVCSILAEKQRPKPKNSSSLSFFASFDTLLDPRGAKVVEKSQFIHFVLKFDGNGAL